MKKCKQKETVVPDTVQDHVRIRNEQLLANDWHVLKKTTFDYRRRDGSWQTLTRETYDRGNGAVALLYNRARRTVLLTRQFRFPAYVNGHDGFLIEAAAGLLDKASPEVRIRAELEEETGRRVAHLEQVFDVSLSVQVGLRFFARVFDSRLSGAAVGQSSNMKPDRRVTRLSPLSA